MAENNQQENILNNLNPQDEKEVLSLIIRRFVEAYTIQSAYTSKWDEYYKCYRGYRTNKNYPWQSNLFVPTAFTVIETLLPRILMTIFSEYIPVRILPREASDVERARLLESLIAYQLEQMDAYNKFYIWIKECLLYGTGILKVFWKIDIKRRKFVEPMYEGELKVNNIEVEKEVIEYDGPAIEPVDIYDFFIDPRATNIDDARWCIHRFWRDYDYLVKKQEEGIYKNVDKIKVGVTEVKDIEKSVRAEVAERATGYYESDMYKIELLEYWEDNRVVTIANRSVILRDEPNPFFHGKKPFVVIKDIELPHEFYGIGEIEPIISLIYERNEIRNQRLDNMKTLVNRILVVDRNADIDLDRLEEDNRPGGIILTNDIRAVQPLHIPDILPSSYNEDAMILRDIQDATAITEYAIGAMPGRKETATAVMQLQQATASRIMLKIYNILINGVSKVIKMIIQLNEQFITKPQVVRIIGKEGYEFKEILPTDISKNYDFVPIISIMDVNKEIRRQQLLLLANNPLFTTYPNVNIEEFQKEILRQFEIKDVDRFIRPMPPLFQEDISKTLTQQQQPGARGKRRKQRRAPGVPSVPGVPQTTIPRM